MALRQDELTSLCDDVDLERDRALVERCQAGDSAAFGNLYARYYERLLRFCMRRLNDRHEAEDAAQEAFARAWKALPRFAGDKRFYPWLTVIAGNICTDMLRRRSRSTPTEDLELSAQQPLGTVADDTSEELVLAAVDGELVHRALDRLSSRHRHVLAMREGSGWTYQQIADHEGVEIGTIETLLWRARQALKREFAAVSEGNGALAGFALAGVALFRRTLFRLAHRGATVQQQAGGSSGGFGLRNALAGVAVAGAAVAAAIIAPHAFTSNADAASTTTPAASALAAPPLALAAGRSGADLSEAAAGGSSSGSTSGGSPTTGGGAGGSGSGGSGAGSGAGAGGLGGALAGATGGSHSVGGTLDQGVTQVTSDLNGAVNTVGGSVNGVTGGLGATAGGVASGVASSVGSTVNGLGGGLSSTVSGATTGLNNTLGSVTQGASNLLGGASANSTASTTTTTLPDPLSGLGQTVDGLGQTVGGLLGGK